MSAIGAFGSMGGYYSLYQNKQGVNPTSTQPVSPVSRAQTSPVAPVSPVPPVRRGTEQTAPEEREGKLQFPTMREGADPAEMAVRARIQYLDGKAEDLEDDLLGWNQAKGLEKLLGGEESKDLDKLLNKAQEEDSLKIGQEEDSKSPQETMEESECQTCKNRKYQDGSDDPGVSFKTATNVAPERAAAAVRGHEQEHVVREQAKAAREGRKVVSQSVTIHTGICPECGEVYVSGGTTRTTTMADSREPLLQQEEKEAAAA